MIGLSKENVNKPNNICSEYVTTCPTYNIYFVFISLPCEERIYSASINQRYIEKRTETESKEDGSLFENRQKRKERGWTAWRTNGK
jgi:hypothetical protein